VEPECPSPYLQQPATCLYLQSDQSSTCPPSNFLKTHFNIILLSMSRSSKWSLSLTFPHQNPVWTSRVSHTCNMPRPYHYSWYDHPKNIWREIQVLFNVIFPRDLSVPHRAKFIIQALTACFVSPTVSNEAWSKVLLFQQWWIDLRIVWLRPHFMNVNRNALRTWAHFFLLNPGTGTVEQHVRHRINARILSFVVLICNGKHRCFLLCLRVSSCFELHSRDVGTNKCCLQNYNSWWWM
jgi:hypothetical protein